MNLFRSEEHIRNWDCFNPETEQGIIFLNDLQKLFSVNHFTKRLEPDYFSRGQYVNDFLTVLTEFGKNRPFWSPQNL
jgi:hypothetical protein